MKSKFLILIILLSYATFGQTTIPFKELDFPEDKFIVKKEQQTLGTITVDIIQVKPNKQSDSKQFSCRTWLTIKEKNRIVKELTQDLESVGGCSGFFFPDKQPNKDLIVISKFGDYDGRLLTINNKGELKDYLGGKFYVSIDNKYLFSNYDSDLSGVTIIDLVKNELIYTGQLKQYISDWYFQDGEYFAVISEDVLISGETGQILFDFKSKTFKERRTSKKLEPKNKLKVYSDYVRAPDCSCGK